jgi:hypothetical protein
MILRVFISSSEYPAVMRGRAYRASHPVFRKWHLQMKTINLVGVSLVLAVAGCATDGVTQDDPITDEHDSELAGPTAERPHCVVETVAYRADEAPPASAKVAAPRCFDTFASAIFAATAGRVELAPSVGPAVVDDATLNAGAIAGSIEPRAATFVIGIEYAAANFGGGTFTVTNTSTCAGVNHTFILPASFNDVVSSARAFSGCNHSIHFENTLSGASRDCGTSCSYIGDAMNDRTSSVRWTR